MNVYLLCYMSLLELMNPNWGVSYERRVRETIPERFQMCVDVLHEAERVNSSVPPELIVATAYEESKFTDSTSHAGAIGPLQILPRYYCPNRRARGCDAIAVGVRTLERFMTRHVKPAKALCHYNSGNRCTAGSRRYARRILQRAERYRSTYKEHLTEFVMSTWCIHKLSGDRLYPYNGMHGQCEQFELPDIRRYEQWLTIHGNTTNRTSTPTGDKSG